MVRKHAILLTFILTLATLVSACGGSAATPDAGAALPSGLQATTLILGAYTTPREAYGQLIPIFRQQWREQTGQDVTFEESYLGSGAQSRAIVEGFEADVAALSLEADVDSHPAGRLDQPWLAEQPHQRHGQQLHRRLRCAQGQPPGNQRLG
ncbi:MAG: hypothetical protein V9H69_26975 [Anaerolineae bacterium]